MKRLIVISGPTASGKTSLSVELAKRLKAPVVSADSRQFYKELSIGTAKPTKEEMQGVSHYFINSHSIQQSFSFGEYEKEASEIVDNLFKKHSFIIVTGGSGMFINSLIYGTDKLPHNKEIQQFWNMEFEKNGLSFLQSELKKKDIEYFNQVDIYNPLRLIRALEIIQITNQKMSDLRNHNKQFRHDTNYFIIDYPRDLLYQRIDARVDNMIEKGLVEEVKKNMQYSHLQPLNTVGYKEIFDYLDGKISKEKAIELIKRNTRRYAKRQLTWLRKEKNAYWIKASNNRQMIENIFSLLPDIDKNKM